jgi:methionyl-tRNA formyltransferase
MNSKTELNLILLARPSCRTVAYCGVMRELGVYPREVIWLPGEMPFFDDLLAEDRLHGYSRSLFDLSLDPLPWLQESGATIHMAETGSVNAPETVRLIAHCSAPDLLFSAAGIVAPATLATGKRFLHVHPGILPDYRGSTCFYYAILEQGFVGASAFVMNENIDDGLLLARSSFKLNLRIVSDQPLFMDHILDPYIRAQVLRRVLISLRNGEGIAGLPNRETEQPVCYVMHPLLRAMAIKRINRDYQADQPVGVFEQDIQGEKQ